MTDVEQLNRRLRRGGFWVLIGRAAGMATVVGIYAVLARVMTKQGVAAYILASSIAAFLSMAAMFGMSTLVCRLVSESLGVGDKSRADAAKDICFRLSAVSVCVVGVASWGVARLLGQSVFGLPAIANSAGLIAIWMMLLALSQIVAAGFRGLHKLRVAGILSGVSGGLVANAFVLVGLIVCAPFTRIDFRFVATLTIWSLLIPTAISLVYFHRDWPRRPQADPTDTRLQPLSWVYIVREAIPIMLVQLMGFGMSQLDIWVVGAFFREDQIATYGLARRLSLLVAVPLTQIGLAVGSSISELHARHDKQNLERILRGSATTAVLAVGIPTLALAAFPEFVLATLFGARFQIGATPLRIMLLGQLVYVYTGLCGPALMMTGRQRVPLWSLLASLPVLALTPWVAIPFGLSAVASLFALATAIQNLVQWAVVKWSMGIDTRPHLSPRRLAGMLARSPH